MEEQKKNSTVQAKVEIDPLRIKTPEIQLEVAGKGETWKPGEPGRDCRDGRVLGIAGAILGALAVLGLILFLIFGWGGKKEEEPAAPATPAPTHKWNEQTNRLEPLSFLFSLFVGTAEAQTVDGGTTANMLAVIEGLRVKNAGLEKALTNGTCDKAAEACTNSFDAISSEVGKLKGQVSGLPSATATKLLPELSKLETSLQSVGVKLDELKEGIEAAKKSVEDGFADLKKKYGEDWKAAAAQPKSEFCLRLAEIIRGKGEKEVSAEAMKAYDTCVGVVKNIFNAKNIDNIFGSGGGVLKTGEFSLVVNAETPTWGPDWPYWAVLPACGVAAAGGWGVSYAQGFSSQTQGITAGISCVVAGGFSFLLSILTN